jgi:hypothetical protein
MSLTTRWHRGVGRALLALSALGCAGRGAGAPVSPDPDRLTAAELAGAREASLYEAIRRLRPGFLQSRGPSSITLPSSTGPAVWVDGTLMGGVEWLFSVFPKEVATVQRLSAWDAATEYGARFPNGVIVVTTHPGGRMSTGLPNMVEGEE